jgi:glucose-6-phosphate isomerase
MPLTHIQLQRCDPYHLGGLVALYEHKVYVQSVIWHINAFDQPSIEQAKQVLFAKQVLLAADQSWGK